MDVYKFTVAAGQRVGFDVDRPAGSGLDSYLRSLRRQRPATGGERQGAAPGENPNVGSYLAYTFANAGTYYVAVSGSPNRTYNPLTGAGDVTGGPTSTGRTTLQLTKIASPIPAAIRAAGLFGAMPIAG